MEGFLDLLVSQLVCEQVHTEARVAACAYVASFVARASFLSLSHMVSVLERLLAWANEYQHATLERLEGAPPTLDVDLHGVFYAVIQGVLYILCYQNGRLLDAPGAPKREEIGAALDALLSGALNPLKFVQVTLTPNTLTPP